MISEDHGNAERKVAIARAMDLCIKEKEAERAERKKNKANKDEETKDGDKKMKDDESSSEEESENEMTAAKLFDNKIHQKANIGEFAGEIICSIQDLPMLIPRGIYSLDFYSFKRSYQVYECNVMMTK